MTMPGSGLLLKCGISKGFAKIREVKGQDAVERKSRDGSVYSAGFPPPLGANTRKVSSTPATRLNRLNPKKPPQAVLDSSSSLFRDPKPL
ncbi:hypothetical protein ACVDG3_18445 [Meridianimarinicoccus sp. RP-17]